MDNSNEDQPLDQSLISALVGYADRFELAVRDGHDFVAGLAGGAIVEILKRFSPTALSGWCSAKIGRSDRPGFLISLSGSTTSPPDAAYLAVVRPAIREFKEALASGNAARAIEVLGPTGILSEQDDPLKELRDLEMELARTGGTRRLEFLPRVAKLALWTGDTNKAEGYAMEALRLEPPGDPFSDGEATHDGNMVLGLIALLRSDTVRAKRHLLESARINGVDYMSMSGPNLSLASELLKRNEREVVIDYLRECRRFWVVSQKTLDIWIEKIRGGENLEFDAVHFTV